jgi:glutathione S-transferase
MAIKIYGQPITRTNRPLWMAAELRLEVENESLVLMDPSMGSLNPNWKQPVLVDSDGTVIYESLAINLYLVRKYGAGSPLAPESNKEEAALLQWTMWATNELDMRLFEAMMHTPSLEAATHPVANDATFLSYFGRPRTPERLVRLKQELQWPLKVLELALTKSAWLGSADRFTAADLNVSIVLAWSKFLGEDFIEPFPKTRDWLNRCLKDRPLSPHSHSSEAAFRMHNIPGDTRIFPINEAGLKARYGVPYAKGRL